ncbi:MAG: capsular biosynthesis protein, partial [Pseudomonadota bacterium]
MLQGPASPFWAELGEGLRSAGWQVHKVHLCLPDQLFWRGDGVAYRGQFKDWEAWLTRLIESEKPSDILYYADRLPYHVIAARVAECFGIRVWCFENGYLRPDWVTMEPVGMSRFSRFPKSPARLQQLAASGAAPDPSVRYPHCFWKEAVREVSYGFMIPISRLSYPGYTPDRYYDPILDYASWGLRVARRVMGSVSRNSLLRDLNVHSFEYTLLAMQLQSDYQIRASSDYGHLSGMLDDVIGSFAQTAPKSRHLVVKGHPMDNGWE